MAFGTYSLSYIASLQPSIQPLATRLLELAAEQGIDADIVQGFRTPQEQTKLYTSGAGVTKAPALLSFHNYGLAFDVVPKAYMNHPTWNPEGALWPKLGAIGESLGLSWGGRWSTPDKPHFEFRGAPITELKAYWEKFQQIMPVSVAPTALGLGAIFILGAIYWFWLRPMLERSGL